MNSSLSKKETIAIGLMLFALFFGAGNMIFPPFLGQEAGENIWTAILGFLITGVGLPLIGIIAISKNDDLQTIANRVHPAFGMIFTAIMYLAIGPFFGIPRTGTVAYEIGVMPFLSENLSENWVPLFLFTILFFGITTWLSLNPSKLIDRIGKLLTPTLLIIIAILVIKCIISPLGKPMAPNDAYTKGAFFEGFIEGYLTMDTIAALAFGIIVIRSIKGLGVTNKKVLAGTCVRAGLIAALGLVIVYVSLAYIGATSRATIGIQENGGAILSDAAYALFGSLGAVILALAIAVACLTTSIGLVSACAEYFSSRLQKLSYKSMVIILSMFSTVIANIGLTQLIHFSVPILVFIYPLAIVLIIFSFLHNTFHGYSTVYICALIPTGVISLIDGLHTAGFDVTYITNWLDFLPLFTQGIGWITPAIIGGILGYFLAKILGETTKTVPN